MREREPPLKDPSIMTHAKSSIWAVVLSRAGSKRLPNKALRLLANRPMSSYYFEALSHVQGIERRFLFSDDADLNAFVQREHPQVELPPFERPAVVSTDEVSSFETLRYFMKQWDLSTLPQWVMLCQCTSPLVEIIDFENALRCVQNLETQSSPSSLPSIGFLSVTVPQKPLHWLLESNENGVHPAKLAHPQTQYYLPNGAFYIVPTHALLNSQANFSLWDLETVLPFEMPWYRSIDIDTAEDLEIAERLMQSQLTQAGAFLEKPLPSQTKQAYNTSKAVIPKKGMPL